MAENNKALMVTEHDGVREWFERLARFPQQLPKDTRYMLARMAVLYGLDPFLGELMVISTRQGLRPYVGIDGMRRAARKSGMYGGRNFHPLSPEERSSYGLQDDDIAVKCYVARTDCREPFEGIGVVGPSHPYTGTAPKFQMARKRAEHSALRSAFDLHLELWEGNGQDAEPMPDWVIEAEVKEIDPLTPEQRARENAKSPAEHVADLFGDDAQTNPDDPWLNVLNGRTPEGEEKPETKSAPAAENPKPKQWRGNGNLAVVRTARFHNEALNEIGERTDYYHKGDKPDPWHVLGSLWKAGTREVTNANLREAIEAAIRYAEEQRALEAHDG